LAFSAYGRWALKAKWIQPVGLPGENPAHIPMSRKNGRPALKVLLFALFGISSAGQRKYLGFF
jgi:hypothetical protein